MIFDIVVEHQNNFAPGRAQTISRHYHPYVDFFIRRLALCRDSTRFFIRRSDATCTTVLIRRESEREMCTRTHHEASRCEKENFRIVQRDTTHRANTAV
ncbi:unnamed protein product, partial [Trichogramma brassicae]